jgi:hypothetical protein
VTAICSTSASVRRSDEPLFIYVSHSFPAG